MCVHTPVLHRYMFAEDGSLHVPSAQVTDTGRYLCMATNQAGTQRKRVDLQVHGEKRAEPLTHIYTHTHLMNEFHAYPLCSSSPLYLPRSHQHNRDSERSDYPLLRGYGHPQAHGQLDQERSNTQHRPQPEYVQVETSFFFSLCFLPLVAPIS